VQGSLFIRHYYLGVKRVKIGFFHQKQLGKQANNNYDSSHARGAFIGVQGYMRQQGMMSHSHGRMSHVQGCMMQPLLCEFYCFWPFFERSSILQCLGTSNEFSSLCVVFKCLLRTIDIQSSYPRSLNWCHVLPIYMISH